MDIKPDIHSAMPEIERLRAENEVIPALRQRIERQQAAIHWLEAENEALKDLAKMIIDAESADETLIKVMYYAWLNKAKQLRGE